MTAAGPRDPRSTAPYEVTQAFAKDRKIRRRLPGTAPALPPWRPARAGPCGSALEAVEPLVEPGAQRPRAVEVAAPLAEQLCRNAARQFVERVRILKNLPESPR